MDDDNDKKDHPSDPETQNLAGKNKPTHTEDNKNTKADHMTELPKNNKAGKLITNKNDLQETPNDTPPFGANLQECRYKYTTKVGPNKPSRDFGNDRPQLKTLQHSFLAKKRQPATKNNININKAEQTRLINDGLLE